MIQPPPLQVFISYSHKDDQFRRELEAHLSTLQQQGTIAAWSDRAIEAGQEWEPAIQDKLKTADIILLLISVDFLASRFISDVELQRAMTRHAAGQARVIPVLLRPCDWQAAPFGKLQAVPDGAKPITKWGNRDEAFTQVAQAIRRAAETLRRSGSAPAAAESGGVERPLRRRQRSVPPGVPAPEPWSESSNKTLNTLPFTPLGQGAAGSGHLGSRRPWRLVGIGGMNETKLVRAAGATAGIGGIAVAAMIILYRDILRAQYLPTLSPQHAAFIIGAIVFCVFFITVLGMFAWLSNQGNTWVAQRAWIFLLIITLILASSLVGIYMLTQAGAGGGPSARSIVRGYQALAEGDLETADKLFEAAGREAPQDPQPSYWRARVALVRGNSEAAIVFADAALAQDRRHEPSLALKVEALMRLGGDYIREAKRLIGAKPFTAAGPFAAWAQCLIDKRLVDLAFVTASDLRQNCAAPEVAVPA